MTKIVGHNNNNIPTFESSKNNQEALQATRNVQSKTLQALERMQNQAAETQAIGHATLQQLEEQDGHMNRTMEATSQLNSNLDKATKLQDRFSVWSLQLGTKRMAKQLIKKEKKFFGDIISNTTTKSHSTDVAAAAKFKRRGPRPKKENPTDDTATTPATSNSIDHVMETSIKESHDMTHQIDRAELFAGVKQPPSQQSQKVTSRTKKKRDFTTTPAAARRSNHHHPTEEQLLNDEEQAELAQIDIDDKAVDTGLDIISRQMDHLHYLSRTMGETAKQQTAKLMTIHKDMDRADDKSRRINQRAKLFTLNRQEKTKERNKFETPQST